MLSYHPTTNNYFIATYRKLTTTAKELATTATSPQQAEAFITQWESLATQAILVCNLYGLRLLLVRLESLIKRFPQWELTWLHYKGRLAWLTGENTQALALFEQQLGLAIRQNNFPAITQAQLNLVETLITQQKLYQAEAVLQTCLLNCQNYQLELSHIQTLNQLGRVSHLQKSWTKAQNYLEQALVLIHQSKVTNRSALAQAEAFTYRWLGTNNEPLRLWDKCESYFLTSLKICDQNRDVLGIAETKIQLGAIYQQTGQYNSALICFEGSLAICEQLRHIPVLLQAYYYKSGTYYLMGKYREAQALGFRAVELAEEANQLDWLARSFYNLGQIYAKLDSIPKATEYYLKALDLYKPTNFFPQWIELLVGAGDFLLSLPNKDDLWDKALECYRQAIDLVDVDEKLDYLASLMGKMGRAFTRIKGLDGLTDAARCYRLELRLAGDLDSPHLPVPLAVALRVEALMGLQRCSALQINQNYYPGAMFEGLYAQ